MEVNLYVKGYFMYKDIRRGWVCGCTLTVQRFAILFNVIFSRYGVKIFLFEASCDPPEEYHCVFRLHGAT